MPGGDRGIGEGENARRERERPALPRPVGRTPARATGWGREAEFSCGRWIDGTVGRRSFAGDDGKHDDHGS